MKKNILVHKKHKNEYKHMTQKYKLVGLLNNILLINVRLCNSDVT